MGKKKDKKAAKAKKGKDKAKDKTKAKGGQREVELPFVLPPDLRGALEFAEPDQADEGEPSERVTAPEARGVADPVAGMLAQSCGESPAAVARREDPTGALPDAASYAWAGPARPELPEAQERRLAELRELVCGRLSGHRLAHSLSVARTAGRMAAAHGVDVFSAVAAGLLHDWDKKLPPDELWEKAWSYGVVPAGERDERMTPVLHGRTAAASLPRLFGDLPPEVFQAIDRHTVGATDMDPLDVVVYVADMLEPLRPGDLGELRALATGPLDPLFAACARQSALWVLATGRYLAPEAVDVWNAYESCLPEAMRARRCRILYE